MFATVIAFVVANKLAIWATVTSAMVFGEKLAKLTKTTKDDEVISKAQEILNKVGNYLALNVISPVK